MHLSCAPMLCSLALQGSSNVPRPLSKSPACSQPPRAGAGWDTGARSYLLSPDLSFHNCNIRDSNYITSQAVSRAESLSP